jgi:glutamate synthase domain-containing protein 2/glutamate synthase domain-containing protein 3
LGEKKNILEEREDAVKQVVLPSPLLFEHELEFVKKHPDPEFAHEVLPATFSADQGREGLAHALDALCHQASQAVIAGKNILILSHRGVESRCAPIPMALAVGAVHHHLINTGQRLKACVIAEAGDVWEVHHVAVLIGYGARAVVPYLAAQTIRRWGDTGELKDVNQALLNFRSAVDHGLLKIMAKMGISTLGGYRGAQVFEAVGLSRSLVERCFAGTPSRLGGIGLPEIADDVLAWNAAAFSSSEPRLDVGGYYKFHRNGEYHAFNPWTIKAFHTAVKNNDPEAYRKFRDLVNQRDPTCVRDVLGLRIQKPAPLEEVEPASSIMRRFVTAAISHGAIAREAHETLAIAMNAIGGKSNSGEGGEDKTRFKPRPDGAWANSAIKQVASGRFGVTAEYLVNAQQLEIKMAQGSKPGEGGQIPGIKVSVEIAAIRHTIPGISLISPPPHHDIYSIEDLAQLIYDLKQINPQASVSVKLVAESGIGAIAAGVAKAHADVIHISGHDGGTGASPLSSIKNAGVPWELGLSEVQQVLIMNDLRGRVTLRADGGMKTGRDVVIAALLGAEEFGFGSSALVAEGCVMARQCHLNTCPVGVATQDPGLRAKYRGTPEMVIRYFQFVAEEAREILASLGFRSLDEAVGRVDVLEPRIPSGHAKARCLDFSALLAHPDPLGLAPRRRLQDNAPVLGQSLDLWPEIESALKQKKIFQGEYALRNTHRTVGARVAGEIARRYGDEGLPDGSVVLTFRGTAGQSFGAFCVRGMRLVLFGEANDYVGKSLCGGEIVLRPMEKAPYPAHANVILGNTVLYGATGGSLFAAGRAGERFAVRNSGARAVVEGAGDHACEYMTGGTVVILGPVGRNLGAGMTGGAAFVLDENGKLPASHNPELVLLDRVQDPEDRLVLKSLIRRHQELTGSALAEKILGRWESYEPIFWKVHPRSSAAKTEAVIAKKE